MRTTIDIPQDLLAAAIEFSHAKTKREAVVAALREYVDREAREQLIRLLRSGAIDMTLEDLEAMRADD
jgi:Arc/MetJ family transcription regulator